MSPIAVASRPAALSRPSLFALLTAWQARRRTRIALSRLDDTQLRDIGVSQDQVKREIVKPFWIA